MNWEAAQQVVSVVAQLAEEGGQLVVLQLLVEDQLVEEQQKDS
jgi:hypothetical protein